jgi:hypothetical protein
MQENMENFFTENLLKNKPGRNHIILLLAEIIFILFFTTPGLMQAAPGNYSETSPFSCGANCLGGNELFGNTREVCDATPGLCYNTIDNCTDGDSPQYEFVDNITVTDLNDSQFAAADTINVDAYLDCSSDGDAVYFVYSNGSAFRKLYNTSCKTNSKVHRYYNFTLDNIGGNHTVRIIIAYKGTNPVQEITCGDQAIEPQWTDTDDVTFLVQSPNDPDAPEVSNPTPGPNTTYEQQDDFEVTICVDADDNFGISSALANVSWETGSGLLTLAEEAENNFCAAFSNTSALGRYNVSFRVNDSNGNVNDSITTYFVIQHTASITLYAPTTGDLFAYGPVPLNFTIEEGYNVASVFYSLDSTENTTVSSGRVNVSFTQSDGDGETGENTSDFANLSMSFKPSENMSVGMVSISLKRNGAGTPNSQLQIRTDDGGRPSDTILAYGNITNDTVSTDNYSFINISLNSTTGLEAGTTYWLFLTPNSSAPDFYSWESNDDGIYTDGEYGNNASLDLLFIVYDAYNYRTIMEGIAKGEHILIVYASEGSGSPIFSPEISFTVDFTEPFIDDDAIIYSPSSDAELDPGVAINITGTVTDDLAVQQVIIQYKKEGDSDFQNSTATITDDLFNGTVTPDSEGTWVIRVMAWDASNNTAVSSDITLDIFYEYDWSREPESFNATSALLEANVSIGNITITNSGDINLSFNISKTASTILSIYFNGTPDSTVINVSAGGAAIVAVVATGQSMEVEQSASILIDALNASANPNYYYTNFTFISFVSGPYLNIEIIEYDATVDQGQTRIGLTARITNVGNETANNVSANWSLPSGWTPKTNVTSDYATLDPAQQVVFTRYVDVGADALTGIQNLGVYVNCSEGKGDIDNRSVNVSSTQEEQETPPTGEGGGGGGGAAILIEKITKLDITLPSEIEIMRGANMSLSGTLKNTGNTNIKNISLALEEFPLAHYALNPSAFNELKINGTATFSLFINVPEYLSEKQEAVLVAEVIFDNTGNTLDALKEFKKAITVIIVTEDKAASQECFEKAASKISELAGAGIASEGLSVLSAKLDESRKGYESKDYAIANSLCEEILKNADLAVKTKGELDAVKTAYDALAGSGKQAPELGELIKLAQDDFEKGDYTLAAQRTEQARLLTGIREKDIQQTLAFRVNFIKENLSRIIPLIALAIIIGIFVHSSTSLGSIKRKVSALEARKENMGQKLKEIQREYFVKKKLSPRLYAKGMSRYRSLLADIENKKTELQIRKLKIISGRALHDLETVRRENEESMKKLHKAYFVEKTMDNKTFKKLASALETNFQKIDKLIELKKAKKRK